MECAEWPVRFPCDLTGEDPDLVSAAVASAQQILWSLSGQRYGICETTESYRLPCTSPCYVPWADQFGPGVEYALVGERRKCCAIHLHSKPVKAILSVEIDGVALDPDEYYLGRSILYRIGQCWPCEDECEIAPIEVEYAYGIDVPPLGELAMGELACEILAGLTGADCRLPSNAISVTRQGVTVDLGDAQTLFDQGRIGLPISDAFLRATNPNHLTTPSAVYSPDLARRVR